MKVLLTGGRGKTALRIAQLLHAANVPFVGTSRSGEYPAPYKGVKFDWLDESTYDLPFDGTGVDRVYIVAPPVLDMVTPMKAFIDKARSKGVTRFILLSASTFDENGPAMGVVHKYIKGLGVDYCVLRPTWFMENTTEASHIPSSIRNQNKIYSATGKGAIPWVSADDIAAVAFHALTDEKSHNTDYLVLGPELLPYDQVAETISKVVGRTISHESLTLEAFTEYLKDKVGIPDNYAEMLAALDIDISQGSEARTNDAVEKVTGRPPKKFATFAEENKGKWVAAAK